MQAILFFSLMASLTVTAIAISCYSCESVYEPNCGEDFDLENFFKLDCSRTAPPRYLEKDLAFRNSTGCMKRVYKEEGVQKIMRSCFFGDVNETTIGCRMDPSLTTVQEVDCHVCDNENFCNSAEHQQRRSITLFGVGFVVLAKLLNF